MALLTRRKQAWVERRKPAQLNGLAINPPAGVASRYATEIQHLVNEMADECERRIRRLFEHGDIEEYFATDDSPTSQARILTNALMKKFNDRFAKAAPDLAARFVRGSNKANSKAVHSSIVQLSGGLSLETSKITPEMREIMKATSIENIQLIKSISQRYLNQMQGAVMRSITNGTGLPDLMPFLLKQKGITHRRAQLISLDQTRKVSNNLTAARNKSYGLTEFEWMHTGGSDEPREDHIHMSGNIYRYDDLPVIDKKTGERGLPGQLINCRCRQKPVIKF